MFKHSCLLPANIQQHSVKKEISVITHCKNQLVRRCVPLNVRAMSLSVCGISLWNSLDVEHINVTSELWTVLLILFIYIGDFSYTYRYLGCVQYLHIL